MLPGRFDQARTRGTANPEIRRHAGKLPPWPPTPTTRAPPGRRRRLGSPREEEVRERLREVVDPELGDTIVDLGMVRADPRGRRAGSRSTWP